MFLHNYRYGVCKKEVGVRESGKGGERGRGEEGKEEGGGGGKREGDSEKKMGEEEGLSNL